MPSKIHRDHEIRRYRKVIHNPLRFRTSTAAPLDCLLCLTTTQRGAHVQKHLRLVKGHYSLSSCPSPDPYWQSSSSLSSQGENPPPPGFPTVVVRAPRVPSGRRGVNRGHQFRRLGRKQGFNCIIGAPIPYLQP